ncbi:MAG: AAA family ATPase, partial [Epsilonproteobacteria bacterium]|nr:AAA family ATPase [Campylobacterota bacterium]
MNMQEITLEAMKTGENIFLTGSAGTGKSHVLKQYITHLRDHKIFPAIVALTGIAASHLKGKTIHSYFALGRQSSVSAIQIAEMVKRAYLQKRFANLNVLIVDEISMVHPSVFDSINNILKAFKKSTKPFGGIQIIVAGDFFQLPPVYKEEPI